MLKPLGNTVLVEIVGEEVTEKGGIYLPDSAVEKPMQSVVVEIGTGGRDKKGNKITCPVKIGQTVICAKYGGKKVKHDGKEFQVVPVEEILAIIK